MVQSVVFNISFLLFHSFNIRRAFCFSEPKIRYKFLISILFIVYIEFKLIRIGQVKRYKEVASVLFNERIYKIVHRTFFLIIFCETLFCSILCETNKMEMDSILIIDDEPQIRKLLSRMMELEGYDVFQQLIANRL